MIEVVYRGKHQRIKAGDAILIRHRPATLTKEQYEAIAQEDILKVAVLYESPDWASYGEGS